MDSISTIARRIVVSIDWLPDWTVSLIVLAACTLAALSLHRVLFRFATRVVSDRDLFWRSLVQRTEGPIRLALVIFGLAFGVSVSPLTLEQADLIRHLLLVCFIALLGWVALTVLHIWTTIYLRRFKLDSEDNLLARKHATQSRILRRVAAILIVMVTTASALMTFEGVRQYGVSLLASAGAAGIVLGLALQPLLKNLVAGIQLAVTQPIRLEDAVIVEGEWGNVEEINATYVVVRLWDWRRMVLPLSYFIEKPFQNWTRESSTLIGTAFLHVDYTAPVDVMRRKLQEIAAASPLWDRRVVNMQVTDLRPATMEIRMLVSASNAGRTFDLRCEVREKMITFLQAEYPHALPRGRAEVEGKGELSRPDTQQHPGGGEVGLIRAGAVARPSV
ncbi:mechanosensitive ion channel family protein [Roseomonas aerophila]|uniref:Mechanosensitive ion channel family protein n=1 Tax=Teichococcus aerophilus TaxID=1224513 RepID=A0ABR7RTK1_9PROT|nr:mechanosensitive ion channel family protein [Pseudoroseomonas aerophila]MBC9209970.1 mechanosensitive ion channel family protein [Pseudoroseomonas aerophila]